MIKDIKIIDDDGTDLTDDCPYQCYPEGENIVVETDAYKIRLTKEQALEMIAKLSIAIIRVGL